jgi:hypothetical protein
MVRVRRRSPKIKPALDATDKGLVGMLLQAQRAEDFVDHPMARRSFHIGPNAREGSTAVQRTSPLGSVSGLNRPFSSLVVTGAQGSHPLPFSLCPLMLHRFYKPKTAMRDLMVIPPMRVRRISLPMAARKTCGS